MFSISNQLYEPSYISLQSALRFYNFIPETVYGIAAVTIRESIDFKYTGTLFRYKQLIRELMFGYTVVESRGTSFNMAKPEKVFLDLAYFDPDFGEPDWLEGMRFDRDEVKDRMNWNDLLYYGVKIGSQEVGMRVAKLLNYYDI